MKKILCFLMTCCLCLPTLLIPVTAADKEGETAEPDKTGETSEINLDLAASAKAAYLMEYTSGKVIYAKNEHEKLYPASMTKMMGLLLIYEALHDGKLTWDDVVTTSEHAASMGGSQVFLEVNEQMSVRDMIKSICIASANDAMVAMAEKVGGTHEGFVKMMNDKAQELSLSDTHFVNATGLHDPEHYTSAYDMALIAQALIQEGGKELLEITSTYDAYIRENSENKFWLVNTNKLLKMATNFTVTGLKTGSTSLAKYCFSGTAEKDGIRLIASIMAAPDYKARFGDALTLLNYGYANCRMYQDTQMPPLPQIPVKNGKEDMVSLTYDGTFSYLSLKGEDFSGIEKDLVVQEFAEAPVTAGEQAGWLSYTLNGTKIGQVPIRFKESVEKASFVDYLKGLFSLWITPVKNPASQDSPPMASRF